MAGVNRHAANSYIWICVSILFLPWEFLFKRLKAIRMKLFAVMFNKISGPYHKVTGQIKLELFKPMQESQSRDEDLRNRGLIRLLEIGVGTGSNFILYPQNVRLILVDPNPFFMEECLNHMPEFLRDKVEKAITCEGEELKGVEDNSVDVVVTSATLCSVRDIHAVLREIHRVLAPGGKYYFLEHVAAKKGTNYHYVQTCLAPLVRILYDGCNVDRDIGTSIRDANLFSKIDMKEMILTWPFITQYIIGPHLMGTAQK